MWLGFIPAALILVSVPGLPVGETARMSISLLFITRVWTHAAIPPARPTATTGEELSNGDAGETFGRTVKPGVPAAWRAAWMTPGVPSCQPTSAFPFASMAGDGARPVVPPTWIGLSQAAAWAVAGSVKTNADSTSNALRTVDGRSMRSPPSSDLYFLCFL